MVYISKPNVLLEKEKYSNMTDRNDKSLIDKK